MQKIRTYLQTLRRSISDPDYYLTILRARMWFSVQFFLVSMGLISLALVPYWAKVVLPVMMQSTQSEFESILAQIPREARFTYADKKISVTGVVLPLQILASQAMRDVGMSRTLLEMRADDDATDAYITLGPTTAQVASSPEPERILYADIDDASTQFSFSKTDLEKHTSDFLTFLREKRWHIALLVSSAFLVSHLFSGLLMIAFYSLLIQGIAWIFGVRIAFVHAFRWGLHIYPVMLVITELSRILAPASNFPIMSVGYLSISLLLVWNMRQRLVHHFTR